MKIAIVINNIIRDNITQLKYAYELHNFGVPPSDPINPYELDKHFPIESEVIEGDQFDNTLTNDEDKLLDEIQLQENKNVYTEKDLNSIYEFIYEDGCFEVFGRANEYKDNTILRLNQLNDTSGHDFYLMNIESPMSKNATLLFLSTRKVNLNGVLFPRDYVSAWNEVDVIVTDHPDILSAKPEGKIAIKYTGLDNTNFIRGYNESSPADYVVNSIGELLNNEIIKGNA